MNSQLHPPFCGECDPLPHISNPPTVDFPGNHPQRQSSMAKGLPWGYSGNGSAAVVPKDNPKGKNDIA